MRITCDSNYKALMILCDTQLSAVWVRYWGGGRWWRLSPSICYIHKNQNNFYIIEVMCDQILTSNSPKNAYSLHLEQNPNSPNCPSMSNMTWVLFTCPVHLEPLSPFLTLFQALKSVSFLSLSIFSCPTCSLLPPYLAVSSIFWSWLESQLFRDAFPDSPA